MPISKVTSPDDSALAALCVQLAAGAADVDRSGKWPAEQLRLCAEAGVFEWFLEPQFGGQGWAAVDAVRGYMALASACLTTTFILTQRTGACRRIAASRNRELQARLLPGLVDGSRFATIGISHLTTSRRHLGRPVLAAVETSAGFRLDGMSPWVTGGAAADTIVMAASLVENGEPTDRELVLAVPTDLPGVVVDEPFALVSLTASATGPVRLSGVEVSRENVIAGPAANVMASAAGGSTGGYETSALALGLARAAIDFLSAEAIKRPDLSPPCEALSEEHSELVDDLLALVGGDDRCTKESIRQRANTFVLRATQAALSAAKGTGYVAGHPAGRWCREALFFLVWSCPQPVANANLCELAGIAD
ncbi:MAG: acyl-CoA dehydrogenase family protein [Pirellulales bacterium]